MEPLSGGQAPVTTAALLSRAARFQTLLSPDEIGIKITVQFFFQNVTFLSITQLCLLCTARESSTLTESFEENDRQRTIYRLI